MISAFPLDFIQFEKRLAQFAPKERLEAILCRADARQMISVLPPQDLLVVIKDVGFGDCLELLEMLTPQQVQTMLDIDVWKGDRLDPKKLGVWLKSLEAANPDYAVEQFCALDIEFISLLFKLYSTTYDYSDEDGLPNEIPLYTITPDRNYIVVFNSELPDQEIPSFLKHALEKLYQSDSSFAIRLVESVRWETISVLEEEELRFRNARLQDLGFAPMDEAQALFAFVDPDRIVLKSGSFSPVGPPIFVPALVLPDNFHEFDVFQKAISALSSASAEHTLAQVVATTNSVHLVETGELLDPQIKDTLRRVVRTCEIALSYLSKGKESEYSAILAQMPIQKLFQVGHSIGLQLGRQVRSLQKDPNVDLVGNGFLRLDSPLKEAVAGVLRKTPMFFEGLIDDRAMTYRFFHSLNDVAVTAKAISEAVFRSSLLGPRGLKFTEKFLAECQYADRAELPSHLVMLATWMANEALDHQEPREPFNRERLQQFIELPQSKRGVAMDRVVDIAARLAPMHGAKTAAEAKMRAEQFARQSQKLLEEEIQNMKATDIELQFINCLLVNKS